MPAATNEVPKLSLYDATTRGAVTTFQNASQPSVAVLKNTADNGISTSSER